MKFIASWLRLWAKSLCWLVGLFVGFCLTASVVTYGMMGWLVAILLATSLTPWYYSAGAFVAWLICLSAMITSAKLKEHA